MNLVELLVYIVIKLFASFVDLICRVYMLVDELTNELNLLVTAQGFYFGMLGQCLIYFVVDGWCKSIYNFSFLPIDTLLHRYKIIFA